MELPSGSTHRPGHGHARGRSNTWDNGRDSHGSQNPIPGGMEMLRPLPDPDEQSSDWDNSPHDRQISTRQNHDDRAEGYGRNLFPQHAQHSPLSYRPQNLHHSQHLQYPRQFRHQQHEDVISDHSSQSSREERHVHFAIPPRHRPMHRSPTYHGSFDTRSERSSHKSDDDDISDACDLVDMNFEVHVVDFIREYQLPTAFEQYVIQQHQAKERRKSEFQQSQDKKEALTGIGKWVLATLIQRNSSSSSSSKSRSDDSRWRERPEPRRSRSHNERSSRDDDSTSNEPLDVDYEFFNDKVNYKWERRIQERFGDYPKYPPWICNEIINMHQNKEYKKKKLRHSKDVREWLYRPFVRVGDNRRQT